MYSRIMRNFKWLALLLVPILIGVGCTGSATETAQTSVPPASPESAATQTALPPSASDPAVTPSAVPSSVQEPKAQGEVFYEDEFTDTASGWPNALVFDNYYIGYHEPDWYHVEVHDQNDNALTVLPDQSFDNFTVETHVFVEEPLSAPEGDFRYGLATHRSGKRFYAFTVSPRTQTWYVLKSSPSGLEVLDDGTDDSLQGGTDADILRVDAIGPTLTFHINGQPVSQINDHDYDSGELGFFVETLDAPRAHIHYDSLTIREPEAPPPLQNVFFADEFTDTASGWPNALVFDNYYIGYHEPDWYHVEVQAQNDNALTVLPDQSFDNFTVETEVFVEEPLSAPEGDFRYGLVTHRSGKRFYAFTVSPRTQTWYVLKSSPSGLEVLDDGTDDSIQGGTNADTLRVDAIGPSLTFHINGQPVSQINDPDYDSGELGFFVETFDAPRAHIHYDSLTIREPEAPPPLQNVFFADEFTDTASGWPNAVVFDNYYIGYHEPDWYHVEVQAQNDNALTVLPDQSFDDFTVETDVFVEEPLSAPEGDFRYGLATHRSGKRFYAFTISPRTQSWYVLKSSPSGLEVLHQGSDDLIGKAGADRLRVDSSGSTLTFHINGRPVSQVNDPDYDSGGLGFYVETFDAPRAHIHYDSLTIREAEATEVTQDIRVTQSEPTQTATPPSTPTSEPMCTVVTGNLNLRSGPGTTYRPPITALPNGTRLEPLARSPDSLWIQVRVPESDQVGWVAAAFAYVSCEVSVPDLPVGDLPATPTGSTS